MKKLGLAIAAGILLAMTPVLIALLIMMLLFPGIAAVAESASCQAGPGGPARIPIVGPYTVTSEFGPRWGRLHDGIDLSSGPAGGAQIVAAAGGTVTDVGFDGATIGRGNYVDIDIGAGITHSYFHLATTPLVTVGQAVSAGQPLGIEGTTGHSTGNHLHFRVHTGDTPTNPRDWFDANGVDVPPLHGTGTGDPADGAAGGPAPVAYPDGWPDNLAGYNSEQLLNAAWIIKAGESLSLDPWSIQVGVMTAMGESSLRVLDYGDEAGPDSRGLFQQRDSWGPLHVRMDPTGSALLFFQALVQVPGYHTMEPTMAAHLTQINADPYYYRPYWSPAGIVVDYFLEHHELLDALPPTSTGALGPGCKAFLTGLITRQDLSVSSIPRAEELTGFVIETSWATIEPTEGAYNFSDIERGLAYAAAHGMRVRLRIMPTAPEWAKTIGGPPVPFHDHDHDTDITIARFWDAQVQQKWHTTIAAAAAAFDADPALGEVNISGVGAYSAEDMLLQLEDTTRDGVSNREHLLAAGFSDAARDAAYDANVAFFQTTWRSTPTTVWAHPYRTLTGTSMDRTRAIVQAAYARNHNTAFGHTGADEKTLVDHAGPAADLYDFLSSTGPFTLQSRSLAGGFDGNHPLGDMAATVRAAAEKKAMAFELPRGDWQSQLPPETVAAVNAQMATNAAAWTSTTPPPDL